MKRCPPGIVAACLLFLVVPAVRAADAGPLRWQFKKDQVLKYLIKHREVRDTAIADQKIETIANLEYEWHLTVKDVDTAGVASVELKLNALKADETGYQFAFTYDSTRTNDQEGKYNKDLKNYFDQLRFATFRMQVKPDGKIGEVYGFDKLLTETTPGTQVAEFHAYWLRDDSFAWFLQMALGLLPEQKVERDAKWKLAAPAKFKDLGQTSGQLEFRLDKPTGGDKPLEQIKVGGNHAVDLDMGFGTIALRGPFQTSKLSGTVRFDPKAGVVEGSEIVFDYDADLKVGNGDQAAKMKVKMRNEVTVERKP